MVIESEVKELNISDLNDYEGSNCLLLIENEEGLWRKLAFDPNTIVATTENVLAFVDNKIVLTNKNAVDGWRPQKDISTGTSSASFNQLSGDSFGNAFSVWSQDEGSGLIVKASVLDSMLDEWSAPVTLTFLGENSTDDAVTSNNAGVAIAAWVNNLSTPVLRVRTYDPVTKNWSAPLDVASGVIFEIKIDMNSSGNAVMSWKFNDGSNNINIQAAIYDATSSTWSSPTTVSTASTNNQTNVCKIDEDGNAFVVWNGDPDGLPLRNQTAIFSRYDSLTQAWSAPDLLPNGGKNGFKPDLYIDPSGTAMLVWYALNDTETEGFIYWSKWRTDLNEWQTTISISPTGGVISYDPRIVMDASGNAVCIWNQLFALTGVTSVMGTYFNASNPGWASPPSELYFSNDNIQWKDTAINNLGNVFAVWEATENAKSVIKSISFNSDSETWSTPVSVSEPGDLNFQSQVITGINSTGSEEVGVVTWINRDNATNIDTLRSSTGCFNVDSNSELKKRLKKVEQDLTSLKEVFKVSKQEAIKKKLKKAFKREKHD